MHFTPRKPFPGDRSSQLPCGNLIPRRVSPRARHMFGSVTVGQIVNAGSLQLTRSPKTLSSEIAKIRISKSNLTLEKAGANSLVSMKSTLLTIHCVASVKLSSMRASVRYMYYIKYSRWREYPLHICYFASTQWPSCEMRIQGRCTLGNFYCDSPFR